MIHVLNSLDQRTTSLANNKVYTPIQNESTSDL